MGVLKTYDRPMDAPWDRVGGPNEPQPLPWPFWALNGKDVRTVEIEPGVFQPDEKLTPGDFVTHKVTGGFGMVIAINEEQLTILWSKEPRNLFANPFPVAQHVNMQSIAQQLVSVQPMTAPSGLIFYLDYTYGDYKLDPRCNEGPWWRKMFWRTWLCTSGKTRSWWRSFSSWARSWRSRKSTSAVSAKPDEFAENLVRKWAQGCHLTRGGLPPSGRTGAPFEGPQAAPENASGDGT